MEMIKTSVTLNKPIYPGFSLLELSKLLMYDFWYNHIKLLYGDKAQLLYTDTDSLIIHIETEDIYQDMKNNEGWYDFNDYPKDHPCYSDKTKKVAGKMKDELNGELVLEFVGIRPKMYSMLTHLLQEKKGAKGIFRHITEKILTHKNYKECVLKCVQFHNEIKQIISKDHHLYTQSIDKISLNPLDTKRWICEDQITRSPYGHPDI